MSDSVDSLSLVGDPRTPKKKTTPGFAMSPGKRAALTLDDLQGVVCSQDALEKEAKKQKLSVPVFTASLMATFVKVSWCRNVPVG